MNQRDALIRAVCENPDDDLPRLVFADWCEENGELERAEFIRIMCRLEELYTAIDRGAGETAVTEMNRLDPRAWELWQRHGRTWFEELPKLPGIPWPDGRWRRGLAGGVTARTVGDYLRHAKAIAEAAPVVGLTVHKVRGVSEFLDCRFLGRLRDVTLAGSGINDRMAEEIWQSSSLNHLRRLDLQFNRITPDWVLRLERKFGTRVSARNQRR